MDLSAEQTYFSQGFKLLGGIDEAGRGPLAGPVVAACVVIKPDFFISEELADVKDSKKLTDKARNRLFEIIKKSVAGVGVGICSPETIDRVNILQATFLAMKMAISQLTNKPDLLLIDGKFPIPNTSYRQEAIIKGDQKVFSIAAASIIAKVTRDRIMLELDEKHPCYGFSAHKGYGTKFHLEAIKAYGPSSVHRLTFAGVKQGQNYFCAAC